MINYSTINILEDDRKLTKFIIDNFKSVDIKITNGSEELISNTNIKKVNPIIYKIKSNNTKLTILYFKCDEIKEKKYYIPKLKQDYTLSELKSYLNRNLL